jgi:hypothetical protein
VCLLPSIRQASVSKAAVHGLSCNTFSNDNFDFVTFGAKHVRLWSLDRKKGKGANGRYKLDSRLAGISSEQKAFNCAAFLPDGNLAVGSGARG